MSTVSAVPRWISSNGWPSDGSITGMVRPEADATEALAMKCSCMAKLCDKNNVFLWFLGKNGL